MLYADATAIAAETKALLAAERDERIEIMKVVIEAIITGKVRPR